MLSPDKARGTSDPSLQALEKSLTLDRLQESFMEGFGRGAKYAHELGSVVALGLGTLALKPGAIVVGGIFAAGAFVSDRIQQQAGQQRLMADFDLSVVRSELERRGY